MSGKYFAPSNVIMQLLVHAVALYPNGDCQGLYWHTCIVFMLGDGIRQCHSQNRQ